MTARNALSFGQRLMLLSWLEARVESLAGRADVAIAKQADADPSLNFKVVTSHVQQIRCADDVPLSWKCSRKRSTGTKASPVSREDFEVLLAAVSSLVDELDPPISAEFGWLVERFKS